MNEIRYRCECGEVLDIIHNEWDTIQKHTSKELLNSRRLDVTLPYSSGIWRYRELLPPIETKHIVSKPEGNTNLYAVGIKNAGGYEGYAQIGAYAGVQTLYLKHEGENPTGSFKDRGMSVGMSFARSFGMKAVACASTGNTSASLASYASQAGLKAVVFIPEGKITYSKLSQAMAYGAIILQIPGDFDSAMTMVEAVAGKMGIYLLNSINPYRLEGQKTIEYELMHQLDWQVPDWIVLPGGNLGNTSAIGKACQELLRLGFISKLPRIAVIQAEGANPFYQSYSEQFKTRHSVHAETVATAIKIGNPVSYHRAKRVVEELNGVVTQVTDEELLDAKRIIDSAGIGCEPASATTVAGVKQLVLSGIIKNTDVVAGILTGHVLKDPDTVISMHKESSCIIRVEGSETEMLKKIDSLVGR